MTEPQGESSQRTKVLGADPKQVALKLPQSIYEALEDAATADYESVNAMIRRLIVAGLRERGFLA